MNNFKWAIARMMEGKSVRRSYWIYLKLRLIDGKIYRISNTEDPKSTEVGVSSLYGFVDGEDWVIAQEYLSDLKPGDRFKFELNVYTLLRHRHCGDPGFSLRFYYIDEKNKELYGSNDNLEIERVTS